MALENCKLCRGTGWQLVPRGDGTAGSVAVACDCGMEERAARVMERARVPKRYEHCDFQSYVTDLADGKTWTAQHSQSLKNANLVTQGFVRDYPGSAEKGLLLMGPSGVGKTHLAVAALKELIHRGHAGLFCDYRELLKEIQASYNPASESTEMKILEPRSEEHTSELQSQSNLVCRLLLEKKKNPDCSQVSYKHGGTMMLAVTTRLLVDDPGFRAAARRC